MLEIEIEEGLSFFERIITQSAGDEALLLEYIRSKAYELQWVLHIGMMSTYHEQHTTINHHLASR